VNGVTTMVDAGQHRIEATVFGRGQPAVVIEPPFGGNAAAWRPIAQTMAEDTTVVTYDRAPYGASSPARDGRTPREIAADLDAVLRSLGVTGSLVLVGHSLGGIYIRAYAARHLDQVAGMVLVESSHESQRPVLAARFTPKDRLLVALTVPQMIVRSKQWRGGADRRSNIREYRMFKRLGAADQALARRARRPAADRSHPRAGRQDRSRPPLAGVVRTATGPGSVVWEHPSRRLGQPGSLPEPRRSGIGHHGHRGRGPERAHPQAAGRTGIGIRE